MKKLIFVVAALLLVGCQPLQNMRADDFLVAVGYASISEQKGRNDEERRIRAMRASKIDAYRELAEQVYGMRVSGRAELEDQRLGTERTSGAVDGVIRGAEVVRSYPVGDSYVTELQLDIRKMDKLRDYGEVQPVPEKRQQTLF
ncbi:flagellar assembly lipoprotein FlgP [Vibrio cyclitrophicus]|uniref:LPP20 family lipoprotein n=1 Tax=unclassified Vibrio TaxID=2614977 RepID=UPI00200B2085|nr:MULTISPECIES: LPP20 family lipoprotein [Vibrio]MCX2759804.1 flagellar assembly lipoprotein FlgP [Vibrio sp. 14G-20]MCX2774570.1 flagellar assembly lipoprotein FlgP [Vibrio sp. Sgm 22]UPR33621.1 flagellar assembly lipoprotein FlgP [Vibrio cyclitrophicus]UPR46813.1 flagellar assembly lipoprotein FlgP [Vibrio cyclitrophicus]UPR52898.1 flagellar assembly lipoprotein FlgP [Vibrio cyclitrophicus]